MTDSKTSNPFDDVFAAADAGQGPTRDPIKRAQVLSRADLPKRFYNQVSVAAGGDGFQIHLDERTIRTPARALLTVSRREVADAIAAEWDAQTAEINPATMPVTRIINAAIDGVTTNREAVIEDAARFAASDLLFYRAEDPQRLAERQSAQWDPVLSIIEERTGARFQLAGGIMPVNQPEASVAAIKTALGDLTAVELAAIHTLASISGSILLALALHWGDLSFETFWQAAHVDEDWNRELWGEDAEASRRRAERRQDAEAAAVILGRT